MKHNNSILLALSCVVGVLMIGLSLNAYAQTSGIIPLDAFNHHGEISIQNIQVSEKEFYKVIHLNIQIKVKDLGLEDSAWFESDSIKLMNENGKSYLPTREECTIPGPLVKVPDGGPCYEIQNDCGKPVWSFGIKGTNGGIGNYHPCFRVEKEFNNFKVYYGYDKPLKPILSEYNQIGNISLNEKNDPSSNPLDSSSSSSNPSDSSPSTSIPSISSASQSATNIFEQLMNFLKQIFHFMILGSSSLHDS